MRIAYLDAGSGISGDMLLGALVHAGVPVALLRQSLAALPLGATLEIEEVDRSGIHAVKVHVLVDGKAADAPAANSHRPHEHDHGHDHADHHHAHDDDSQPHQLPPHEARSLSAIRTLITKAALPEAVKARAILAFELLGTAEARIHHVPIETIHFHEVGAVDAIADIVLTAAAAHALQIDAWHCSPLNVGSGSVQCAHGRFPVPAPATAELLRGAPTYSSGIQSELVTPTGAALIRALKCSFGPLPKMTVDAIGYGAGTQNPPGFANVLRLSLGESSEQTPSTETVWVLETALDDLSPQVVAHVTDQAMKLGALDVMCTPLFMKKNRPGTLLTVLSDAPHLEKLQELLLRETSTLGLRLHEEKRVCLDRRHVAVATEWGSIRLKIGHRGDSVYNVAPEFDDCRLAAEARGVPVKRVMEAALQAYRQDSP